METHSYSEVKVHRGIVPSSWNAELLLFVAGWAWVTLYKDIVQSGLFGRPAVEEQQWSQGNSSHN